MIGAPSLGSLRSLKFGFHIIAGIAEHPSEDQDNSIEIHQMSDSTEILHQSSAIVLLFCNIIYLIG